MNRQQPPSNQPPHLTQHGAVERVGRIVAVTGAHAIILLDVEDEQRAGRHARSPEIGTLLKVDYADVDFAGPGLRPEFADAVARARATRNCALSKSNSSANCRRMTAAGRRPSAAAFPAIPRSATSSTAPTSRNSQRPMPATPTRAIRIGHIQQDSSIPAMIKIDEMLGKHFAVLGTTGTGKSCAVALILRRILEKNPQAHILLLDVHREYAQSFKGLAEVITPDNMNLPFWLLNFDEIVEILIGQQPNRETDIEVLRELIPHGQAALHAQSAPRQGPDHARPRDRRRSPISASIRRFPIAPPISSACSRNISASSTCAANSPPTSG